MFGDGGWFQKFFISYYKEGIEVTQGKWEKY